MEGFGTEFAYNDHFTPDGTLLQGEVVASPVQVEIGYAPSWASALDANGDLVAFGLTIRPGGGYPGSYDYPVIGSRVTPDDYTWAGDPSFHWNPYPHPQPPASTPTEVAPPTAPTSPTAPPTAIDTTTTTATTPAPQSDVQVTSTTPIISEPDSMLLQLSQARKSNWTPMRRRAGCGQSW